MKRKPIPLYMLQTIQEWQKSGRVLSVFPLAGTISLSGFPPLPYDVAYQKMQDLSREVALARDPGKAPKGRKRAVLTAAIELGRRWSESHSNAPLLEDPIHVWEHLHAIRAERKEHFVALYLDGRDRLIHQETVSVGTLTASLVHPREVFGPAVERRAAAIVVAHNHPSSELRPSPEDIEATKRLTQAGRILGVPLLDHVIVTDKGHFSFRREGLL